MKTHFAEQTYSDHEASNHNMTVGYECREENNDNQVDDYESEAEGESAAAFTGNEMNNDDDNNNDDEKI